MRAIVLRGVGVHLVDAQLLGSGDADADGFVNVGLVATDGGVDSVEPEVFGEDEGVSTVDPSESLAAPYSHTRSLHDRLLTPPAQRQQNRLESYAPCLAQSVAGLPWSSGTLTWPQAARKG